MNNSTTIPVEALNDLATWVNSVFSGVTFVTFWSNDHDESLADFAFADGDRLTVKWCDDGKWRIDRFHKDEK